MYYRVSRIERDNNQKRTLLGDQRSRVKQALENAKSDADSLVSNYVSPLQGWEAYCFSPGVHLSVTNRVCSILKTA